MTDTRTFFQQMYAAFNRRDIDATLAFMSDRVDWLATPAFGMPSIFGSSTSHIESPETSCVSLLGVFFLAVTALHAEVVACPATQVGKRLTDAAFFEWTSVSDKRSMQSDRKTLPPDESRIEGDDWFQSWHVTHTVEGNGLQMVCKYQGLRSGLFIEITRKVSLCTLTKKEGVVNIGCR